MDLLDMWGTYVGHKLCRITIIKRANSKQCKRNDVGNCFG
jgi:hypothetical protein